MARTLKICAIGDGKGVHVQMRSRCFVKLGHEAAILSDEPVQLPDLEVLAPTYGHATAVRRALSYLQMIRLLWRWHPDVLVIHFASRPFNWLLPLVWFKPFAVSVMGGDILFHQRQELSPHRQRATLRLLALADLIISPSAYAIERYPEFQHKSLVSSWGIEIERFARPAEFDTEPPLTRAALGIPETAAVIFSPRRIVPVCGVITIVESMALVRTRVPNAVLLLVDYAPDAAYRRQLVETIDRLGLHSCIRWVTPRDYALMPDLYAVSDVTVSVARSDGLSQSVLESMAAGKPVVLGDLPNYSGVFENGRHCRLVDPQDAASIAAGVVEVLTDPGLRARIVEEGRIRVEREDDFSKEVKRIEARLLAVVDAPQGPRRILARLGHGVNLALLAFERDDRR